MEQLLHLLASVVFRFESRHSEPEIRGDVVVMRLAYTARILGTVGAALFLLLSVMVVRDHEGAEGAAVFGAVVMACLAIGGLILIHRYRIDYTSESITLRRFFPGKVRRLLWTDITGIEVDATKVNLTTKSGQVTFPTIVRGHLHFVELVMSRLATGG